MWRLKNSHQLKTLTKTKNSNLLNITLNNTPIIKSINSTLLFLKKDYISDNTKQYTGDHNTKVYTADQNNNHYTAHNNTNQYTADHNTKQYTADHNTKEYTVDHNITQYTANNTKQYTAINTNSTLQIITKKLQY